MGIQQSALFLADSDSLVLQPDNVETFSIPLDDAVCRFLLKAQNPVRDHHLWISLSEWKRQRWQKYTWGELFAPMVFRGQLRGVLILGERVTADVYSDTDIQIIATIAYQGALAYANVQLVERLRGLAQQLVRADENQRKRIARDLHDGVLQNLFFVRQQLSEDQVELAGHLSNIIDQLRQMINTQRTALLDQGLELALQSLVMDMQTLAGKKTTILWNNAVDGGLNLTDEQATSIYRIVQEAISNALKHAQAEYINVNIKQRASGLLKISIEDDGIGMPKSDWKNSWEHHYGVVGMKERALMIGADLKIKSDYGEGTTVLLELHR
jgi:signal transduction histidine kinase